MILLSLSLLVAVSIVINILLILYKFLDNIYDMVIHTDGLLQKKVCIYNTGPWSKQTLKFSLCFYSFFFLRKSTIDNHISTLIFVNFNGLLAFRVISVEKYDCKDDG